MKKLLLFLSVMFAGYGAFAQCQASFTYTQNQATITTTNNSTGGGNFMFYSWDFGDGNTSFQYEPTYTYAANGGYVICLTISDTMSGCTSVYCDSVLVTGAGGGGSCTADFSNTASNLIASFTNNSSGGGAQTNYYWDFGDGGTSTQTNPTYTYSATGTYTVCLLMIDSLNNCSDNYCSTITVSGNNGGGPCVAGFTSSTQLMTTSFSNTSTGSNLTYYWDFGDGSTSSTQNPTYTYANNGTYLACLTVYNVQDSTCYDTYCDSVVIGSGWPACQASFYWWEDSVNSSLVWMVNNSTGGGALTYSWDFGDGTSSTQAYPTHTYSSLGSYLVCLTIADNSGCTSVYCDTVSVTARSSGFTINVVNDPASVGMEDISAATIGQVYPNPVANQVTIALNSTENGSANVAIYNTVGALVQSKAVNVAQGDNSIELDMSNLSKGIYILSLQSEELGLNTTLKLIKQ